MIRVTGVAVVIDGRGLMLTGPSGSGKSELALAAINRGAKLIGDDAVDLQAENGVVMARGPADQRGRIALRDIGIVTLPCETGPVPLALVAQLDQFNEPLPLARLGAYGPVEGLYVPQISVNPATFSIMDKLLLALDRWGL